MIALKTKRNGLLAALKKEYPFWLMLLPAVVLVGIYSYGSMTGTVIAFQRFIPTKGFLGSDWVGLQNFNTLFSMPSFFQVIGNTIRIAIFKMLGGIIVPVTFALLLNEVRQQGAKRFFQTLVYLPHFLSWIILAGIFKEMLSRTGIINAQLASLGIEPVGFLSNQKIFPWTMIVTDIWKGFGFGSIIYLAALTGIDPSLYEAARIDGAGRINQTRYITLPGILSTIVLMSVLSLANILNGGFDQIYNMYTPAVYATSDILDTFVYRLGIDNAQFALSTAASLFKSAVSFVFIVASHRLAHHFTGYRIF